MELRQQTDWVECRSLAGLASLGHNVLALSARLSIGPTPSGPARGPLEFKESSVQFAFLSEWPFHTIHEVLDAHEFEHAVGVDDGQRSLACCRLWGCKESDTTEPELN